MPPIWRERLAQWESQGQLRFVQGGGNGEIARLIEFHLVEDNCRRAFGLPSDMWSLTHFIIYDHDGDHPLRPGEGARKLDRLCKDKMLYHRLERRNQENYLPISVLEQLVSTRVTAISDQRRLLQELAVRAKMDNQRHFLPLPQLGDRPLFKNEFSRLPLGSLDEAMRIDGVWIEMTRLAEDIAANI
ncbi:hypothetical protein [Massilia varians]|uniref:hypothetical protein n=1 Tax=Massilia varians TaxID=457921 RepID=UPI00255215F3|nr:hypothetical protein [Massilia varians]MDK6079985.1 hypothetical protein [Massilia varians]